MRIRSFRVGDEMALRAVHYSSIHELASEDYTPEQIEAWAPKSFDRELWIKRMRGIRPFVVEDGDEIIAYADIQSSGYIDHFFVSAQNARQGVGTMLMERIRKAAEMQGIRVLSSDVSRTAQPFFPKFGFLLVEERSPVIRGVVVPNARMKKELAASDSGQ